MSDNKIRFLTQVLRGEKRKLVKYFKCKFHLFLPFFWGNEKAIRRLYREESVPFFQPDRQSNRNRAWWGFISFTFMWQVCFHLWRSVHSAAEESGGRGCLYKGLGQSHGFNGIQVMVLTLTVEEGRGKRWSRFLSTDLHSRSSRLKQNIKPPKKQMRGNEALNWSIYESCRRRKGAGKGSGGQ